MTVYGFDHITRLLNCKLRKTDLWDEFQADVYMHSTGLLVRLNAQDENGWIRMRNP